MKEYKWKDDKKEDEGGKVNDELLIGVGEGRGGGNSEKGRGGKMV